MSKKVRQEIFEKTGGKCAYCGCELGKGWHADHMDAVNRNYGYNRETRKWFCRGLNSPENDHVDNLIPSCPSCNITKSGMSVEDFRGFIERSIDRLNKGHYNAYKFGKRFGLIHETPKSVVFYFETLANKVS